MLPYKRSKRVGDQLRREVADIIMRRLKDPRIGFLTVTAVKVTDDLREARVYVTVLKKEETQDVLDALNSARGFIRGEVKKRLRMKIIPEFSFYEDDSVAYGEKIDHLLKSIKSEKGGEDEST
ncbi:MAG: 30S ribosome-binding factor RbfA [Nitrospirae bacterium]|nr:MAG: 30S ribosome-binding factor RbfA [Nitrospirota bacterium]